MTFIVLTKDNHIFCVGESGNRVVSVFFLVCAAVLIGCAEESRRPSALDDFAEVETSPMTALEGYRDDTNFYVKYRLGGRIYYAGGNWRDRVELVESPAPAPPNFAIPSLVPMQYHQATPWASLPPDVVPMPILGVDKWHQLRGRLLRAEVPADGSGLTINFENAEYFLYYDRQGVFQATRLHDKPTDYRVHANLRFDEFLRRGRPILQQYLAEQGIEHTEFVFSTGDAGWYSLPFLYVNIDRRLLVFIRNVPIGSTAVTKVPGLKSGQAVSHVLKSHFSSLLARPVSSLHRLFFAVTDTAVSSVRFDWATGLVDRPVPELADSPPMDLHDWERDLEEIASLPATNGEVEFLVDGEAFFTRFIDSLTSAQDSIHLQTYIFDNDDYATKIGELLKRRSNEGVEVKVLLDGLGTIFGTMNESQSLPEHHEPPASVRWFLESESRVDVRQKANPWFASDHVKSTIVDHEIAFVGGMNIGREYRYDWHDLMMELRGPVVDQITAQFNIAWSHAGPLGDLDFIVGPAAPIKRHTGEEGYPIRILLTRPGIYEIHEAQLDAVRRAQRYVYVQNAYFTDDRMLREMVLARRRGVDVRVIIPLETDFGPISRNNVLAANVMLENGIRVFIYPGFSHVKAAVFDGWACVGSANFDRLSFRVNRELNVAFSDPEAIRQLLEQVFEPDFRASPELTERFPERWVDHLVEIIGDFLY